MKFIVFNFIKAIKYWYSHINPCENVIAIIYDKKNAIQSGFIEEKRIREINSLLEKKTLSSR